MIGKSLQENVKHYKKVFKNDATIKFRTLESMCGKVKCCIIFMDGMIDRDIMGKGIILPIQNMKIEGKVNTSQLITILQKHVITINELKTTNVEEEIIKSIFYGDALLIIDGCELGILLNCRGFKIREISEPTDERVTKGPKEGFTESIIVNTSLIRRRLLDKSLKFIPLEVGTESKTKVLISYVEGVASQSMINRVINRVETIKGKLVIDSNYISENITDHPYSIVKTIGSTERPDVIAAKLSEGKVAILCDGSPQVLYVPFLFYEYYQVNEDYYLSYIYAVFNRMLRVLAFLITTSLPAVYLALVTYHQQMLPRQIYMSIAVAREGIPFPTFFELLLMMITFEILREGGTRLPQNIGQAISIVGAIVLGEAAVSAKLVSAPIVIIASLTGITSLMLSDLTDFMLVVRFGGLIIASLFGLYGFIFWMIGISVYLLSLNSVGVPYMDLIYNPTLESLKDAIYRSPFKFNKDNVKNTYTNEE